MPYVRQKAKKNKDMLKKIHISRDTMLRAAIFACGVIMLYLLTPRNSDTSYEYAVGRPWNYDAVVASVDIPIFQEPARQKEIEDSMKLELKPIFYRSNKTAGDIVENFTKALDNEPRMTLLPQVRRRLASALQEIYRTGVIDSRGGKLPPIISMRTSATDVKTVSSSDFYTFATAHARMQEAIGSDTMLHRVVSQLPLDIRPNILYDSVTNDKAAKDVETFAHSAIDRVTAGTKIVDRNDIVTPRIYTILRTYEQRMIQEAEEHSSMIHISGLGAALLLIVMLGLQFAYLRILRPDYFENIRVVLLTSLTIVSFAAFAFVMNNSFERGIYMVPFTIIPIILIVFLDSRTAFFTYLITILTVAATTHFMWDFILLQFVAGFIALISIRELSKRSQLIQTGAYVFVSYSIVYIGVECMQTGTVTSLQGDMFGALAINAVLISFAYILIFLIEKTFGFISRVTLVELSDINHPLLRELSEECPGTFQHSMTVSNIAAAAAGRIGANVQLVRAGALYHDIGKIGNPAFFTENQHGINPHDALSPMQSARIVIGHVKEGLRRAEKAKLPPRLRDFILEHHGRGTARYFYTTYCNQHPGEEVDPDPFTYPGPNPQSLETSILMMADSVEAASRSLKDHSPKSIETLVNKIIDTQVAEGLHNDSPISFRDISEIKKSFISTLTTMYHSRISYPEATNPQTSPTEKND